MAGGFEGLALERAVIQQAFIFVIVPIDVFHCAFEMPLGLCELVVEILNGLLVVVQQGKSFCQTLFGRVDFYYDCQQQYY
jgi:hypothetical protein